MFTIQGEGGREGGREAGMLALTSSTGFASASSRSLSIAFCPLSALLHAKVTLAPIFASSRAVIYPIPVLAPVTTKCLPRRSWLSDFAWRDDPDPMTLPPPLLLLLLLLLYLLSSVLGRC